MVKCLATLVSWFSSCNCDPQFCRILRQVRFWPHLRKPLPPLLPLTNTDSHSNTPNLQKLELGKFGKIVFAVASTIICGLIFAEPMNLKEVHQLIIVGLLMLSCAAIYNGHVFGEINPSLGNVLQLIGITLTMCLLCVLVGTLLSVEEGFSFSYACWVCALLYLPPPLYYLCFRRSEDVGV